MAWRRTSIFRSLLTFFGLSPEYRSQVFQLIHEIVFHGKGGYDWHTVYNMPIWLRRLTAAMIKDHYEKEQEAIEKSRGVEKLQAPTSKVSRPGIKHPTYTTKASPK
jgi:hypothetical protein